MYPLSMETMIGETGKGVKGALDIVNANPGVEAVMLECVAESEAVALLICAEFAKREFWMRS